MDLKPREIEKTLEYVLDLVTCIRPFEEVIWDEEILAQSSYYGLVFLCFLSKMNLSAEEFNLLPPVIISLLGVDPDSDQFLEMADEIAEIYHKLLTLEEAHIDREELCPVEQLIEAFDPLKELMEEPVIQCALNHAINQVIETELLQIYYNNLKPVPEFPGVYPGCDIEIHDEAGDELETKYLKRVIRDGKIYMLFYEDDPDEVLVFYLVIDVNGNMSIDPAEDDEAERLLRSLDE